MKEIYFTKKLNCLANMPGRVLTKNFVAGAQVAVSIYQPKNVNVYVRGKLETDCRLHTQNTSRHGKHCEPYPTVGKN